MVYLLVAFILLISSLLELCVNNRSFRASLLIIVVLGLVVITGFRTWGGSDLDVYQNYYLDINNSAVSYGLLYEYLNRAASFAGLHFSGFLMLLAVVVIPPQAYFFFKSTKYPVTAVFGFFTLSFIWLDHVLIRQSLASVFFLMAALGFLNRKPLRASLSLWIASFFHASALAAWACWAVFRRDRYYFAFTILLLLFSLFSLFIASADWSSLGSWVSPNIPRYFEEDEGVGVANIVECVAAIFLYLFSQKQYNLRKFVMYRGVLVASVFITLISYEIAALARFLEYSRLFYVVIAMKYLESTPRSLRVLYFVPFYVYGLAKLYHFCMTFDDGAPYYAYLQ